jgi:hypothetical protein
MATTKSKLPIGEQIREALDGRSQRWLGQKLDLTDDYISRKMNGILEFTDEEIEMVNTILSLNLKK